MAHCNILISNVYFMLTIILALVLINVSGQNSQHDHHENEQSDHEDGTQGYGEECLVSDHSKMCKSNKGLVCNTTLAKATCQCDLIVFPESEYKKENDTCVAKLNKKCRLTETTIPCEDKNSECSKKTSLCECKTGLECSSGIQILSSKYFVPIHLVIGICLTYLVL